MGFVKTARIKALKPATKSPAVIKKIRRGYYEYMSQVQEPTVAVIEDLDYPQAIGAYWGEINTWIHKSFGIAGVLTNGVMRDLGDIAPQFQVISGSIGPSHGFVHVVDFDKPVKVFGMAVKPGQLIHADQHGAVLIPENVIDKLLDSIKKLMAAEKIILTAAKGQNFTFEKFKTAWDEYYQARV